MDQTASSAGKVIVTTFRRDAIVHVHDGFALLDIVHYYIRVYSFEEDGRSWRERYEEAEASRNRLKEGISALASLYTETLQKVRVHCPKCGTLLARSGRCGRCG